MGARLHTRIATFFLLGIAVSAAAQVIGVNQGGTGATTANAAMTAFGITQTGSGSSQVDTFPGEFNGKSGYINNTCFTNPSGVDIATQINNCISSGYHRIYLVAGTYTSTGEAIVGSPGITITGDGVNSVIINSSAVTFMNIGAQSSSAFTISSYGTIGGFTLNCTNTAAECIQIGSAIKVTLKDANIYGPGGITSSGNSGTSQGLYFFNQYGWTERWSLVNIDMGGFNQTIHFVNPVTTSGGTESYAYGSVSHLHVNMGYGSVGTATSYIVTVDANAQTYNILQWSSMFNIQNTTTNDEIFHIAGKMSGVNFGVTGENAGANYTLGHVLTGGSFNVCGGITVFGNPPITVDTASTASQASWTFAGCNQPSISATSAGVGTVVDSLGNTSTVLPGLVADQSGNSRAYQGWTYNATSGMYSPFFAIDAAQPTSFSIYKLSAYNNPLNGLTPLLSEDSNGNLKNFGSYTQTSAQPNTFADFLHITADASTSNDLDLKDSSGVSRGSLASISASSSPVSSWPVQSYVLESDTGPLILDSYTSGSSILFQINRTTLGTMTTAGFSFNGSPISTAASTGATVSAVTVGASPYAYSVTTRGDLCISGGTVTAISITRSGTSVPTGAISGCIPGMNGDTITTTYSAVPTMNFVPE